MKKKTHIDIRHPKHCHIRTQTWSFVSRWYPSNLNRAANRVHVSCPPLHRLLSIASVGTRKLYEEKPELSKENQRNDAYNRGPHLRKSSSSLRRNFPSTPPTADELTRGGRKSAGQQRLRSRNRLHFLDSARDGRPGLRATPKTSDNIQLKEEAAEPTATRWKKKSPETGDHAEPRCKLLLHTEIRKVGRSAHAYKTERAKESDVCKKDASELQAAK